MKCSILLLSVAFGLSTVAGAQTAPDAPPAAAPSEPAAAPAAAAPDPDEKICKVQRELGSNRLKRVCRTRAEIEMDREAARETLSREQRR